MSPAVLTVLYVCVTLELADSLTYHVVLQQMNTAIEHDTASTIGKLVYSSAITSTNVTVTSSCDIRSSHSTEQKSNCIDIPSGCSVLIQNINPSISSAIKVESSMDFNLQVFVANPLSADQYEGYQAIPDEDLGDIYYIVTYCTLGGFCQFSVTAIQNNTSVMVTFPGAIPSIDAIKCMPGKVRTGDAVALNEFEILYCESEHDLTGTMVTASAPVAVFAGTRDIPGVKRTTLPAYMFDQMIPAPRWGTRHSVVPNIHNKVGDLVKIITRENATTIKISGYSPFIIPNGGESIVRRIDWGSISMIDSNYPVMIAQFSGIHLYNSSDAVNSNKPSMLLLQAHEHWTNSFSVTCPSSHIDDGVAFISEHTSLEYSSMSMEYGTNLNLESKDDYEIHNSSVMVDMYTVLWTNSSVTEFFVVPNASVGVYVFCKNSGIYAAGRDMSTVTEGCIHRTRSVSLPGDGIDNDCDGHVDSVTCTDADRQLNFVSSLVTNETRSVLEISPSGVESISFTVQTCGSAEIVLKSTFVDDVYVHIGFTNTDVQVDTSSQQSTFGSQLIPDICNTAAVISISWFIDTVNTSQRRLQVQYQTDTILYSQLVPDARYDKMLFSSLMYAANYTIDVMTKDCAKIKSGGSLDSLGIRFIIPTFTKLAPYTIYITPTSDVTVTTNNGYTKTLKKEKTPISSREVLELGVYDWAGLYSHADGSHNHNLYPAAPITLTTRTEVSVYLYVHGEGGMHIIPEDVLGPTYLVPSRSMIPDCKIYPVRPHVTPEKKVVIQSPDQYDYLSGTGIPGVSHVHGLQPFALFCEHLSSWVQIPPLESLGKTHYIPAMDLGKIKRRGLFLSANLHITTAEDSTYLHVSGNYDIFLTLNTSGDTHERVIQSNKMYTIESSKAVLVTLALELKINRSPYFKHTVIIPPVQQYKSTHMVPTYLVQEMDQLGSYGVTNAGERAESLVKDNVAWETIRYDYPTFTISVFLTKSIDSMMVLLSDVTYEHHNKICRINNGKYNDSVDNDCDGLIDEEVCADIPSGEVDSDIDGNINEDCRRISDSYMAEQLTTTITSPSETTPLPTIPSTTTSQSEQPTSSTIPSTTTSQSDQPISSTTISTPNSESEQTTNSKSEQPPFHQSEQPPPNQSEQPPFHRPELPTNKQSEQPTSSTIPSTTTSQSKQPTSSIIPSTTTSQPEQPTSSTIPSTTTSQSEQPTPSTIPSTTTSQSEQPTSSTIPSTTTSQPEQPTSLTIPNTTTSQSEQPTPSTIPSTTTSQSEQPTSLTIPSTTTSQSEQPTSSTIPSTTTSPPEQTMSSTTSPPTSSIGPTWSTEPIVSPPGKTRSAPTLPPIADATTQVIHVANTPPPPGSTAAPEETCVTDCVCPCGWTEVKNLTESEIKVEVAKIQTKLRINKRVLSSAVRKRTSATDTRTSATAVGYGGLGFLVITISSIVLLDCMQLLSHFRMFRDNLRHFFHV